MHSRMRYVCNSFWPDNLNHPLQFLIALSIFSIIAVVCNSILIYTLVKTKQTQKSPFLFVLVMSLSDLLIGTVVMPAIAIAVSLRHRYRSCLLDQIINFMYYFLCYFSYFMLMCIAFERLYKVRKRSLCGNLLTSRQAYTIVIICLVVSAFGCYFAVTLISFALQVTLTTVNVCLISTVFVSYIMVLRKIKVHSQTVQLNLSRRQHRSSVFSTMDAPSTRTITFLLVTLIITYAPFNITTPILTYVKYNQHRSPSHALSIATMWAYLFILAYCFTNAIIIMHTNGRTRRFIRQKFNLHFRRGDPAVTAVKHIRPVVVT